MHKLSKFESITSGMPHILEYCGVISLHNISSTSHYCYDTTRPLLLRKLQKIPHSCNVNDSTMILNNNDLVYSKIEDTIHVKISFKVPYEIYITSIDMLSTLFKIYTPFHIWEFDTNMLEFLPHNYGNIPEYATTMDVLHTGEMYSQSHSMPYSTNTLYKEEIINNSTKIKIMYNMCKSNLNRRSNITGISIRGISIRGINIEHNIKNNQTIKPIILIIPLVLFIIITIHMNNIEECIDIIPYLLAICIIVILGICTDPYIGNKIYHEKRSCDW